MNSPNRIHEPITTLSPCNSTTTRRRRSISTDSNKSPEFEFWMVRNPSFPQPNLLSADELFVDGVLLPLHLLSHKPSDPPDPNQHPDPEPENKEPEAEPGPALRHVTAEAASGLTSSKRWKDIFKKGDKKTVTKNVEDKENKEKDKEKEKEKKREKKSQSGATSAELNINIWPFSRSRSAGNGGTRPRMVPGVPATRKVSSAPCSRSNSAGESKSRKWPSSPSRGGVHLGRSSPIWQVKRGGGLGVKSKSSEGQVRSGEKGADKKEARGNKLVGSGSNNNGGGGGKARVLNLNVNVPMCIGYRHHLSCRSDENSAVGVGGGGGGGGGGATNKNSSSSNSAGAGNGNNNNNFANSGNNLFNLRSLFTKKVF